MNLSSLFKQLKKRLRMKRRWLSLGFFIAAVVVCLGSYMAFRDSAPPGGEPEANRDGTVAVSSAYDPASFAASEAVIRTIRGIESMYDVYAKRIYVCGEMEELLGRMDADQIERMHREHPEWKIELAQNGNVTFTEQINDLSPACKSNAYFGLDKDGNLSLFDGPPEDDKVLRTFFQMNMGYLESSLPLDAVHQLREGIPVADLAEYNSVLSTFSDFAVEETEKVMKPAP